MKRFFRIIINSQGINLSWLPGILLESRYIFLLATRFPDCFWTKKFVPNFETKFFGPRKSIKFGKFLVTKARLPFANCYGSRFRNGPMPFSFVKHSKFIKKQHFLPFPPLQRDGAEIATDPGAEIATRYVSHQIDRVRSLPHSAFGLARSGA